MNRETKRMMAKQEAAAEKERARQMPLQAGGKGGGGRGRDGGVEKTEGRIRRFRRFLKEVRQELKKVAWPSRQEVITYTVVVMVSVTFVTLLVFGLDFAFGKGVLKVFSR